jgi:hypothetical protein
MEWMCALTGGRAEDVGVRRVPVWVVGILVVDGFGWWWC